MRLLPLAGLSALALLASAASAQAPGPPKLGFPLACEIGKTCEIQHYMDRDPAGGMVDYHCGHRTEPKHNAIDIRLIDMAQQKRGVDVLAAAAGRVLAVRDGVPDNVAGQPLPKTTECGNRVAIDHGDHWITDYCHLEKGTLKVKAGDTVQAGQPIGQVGLSGLTEFPHLHMSLQHGNTFVDPFAPNPGANPSCGAHDVLWTPTAMRQLAYKRGEVLVAGLSGQQVGTPETEAGNVPRFTASAPVLVLYTRVIGLEPGDQIELVITGPGGKVVADQRAAALPRYRDQTDVALAHRRPPTGWEKGAYAGFVKVWRDGKVAIEKKLPPTAI
jgi:hypothetical protein